MTDKEKLEKIRSEVIWYIHLRNEGIIIGSCGDFEKLLKFIDSMQEEPVSEDLGDYINELSKQFPEVSFAKLSRIAVRVAKWQEKQDQSTIELAEDHAMLAGMEKMKEQIMAKAIDGKIYETQARSKLKAVTTGNLSRLDYRVGDKVKVIVIKED